MTEVSISVDYADPAKHDEQRGMKGAFARAIDAIAALAENRVSPDQRVHMISVVMDDNLDDIEKLIKLSREIGVTYLVTLYSDGRGKKLPRLHMKQVGEHLLKLRRKYEDFLSLPRYLERYMEVTDDRHGVTPCYVGKNLFNIDCQGNVTLCIDSLDDPVGNILSDAIEDIRQWLLQEHHDNACGRCWTSCRGSVETLMYGKKRLYNALKSYDVIKAVPLGRTR